MTVHNRGPEAAEIHVLPHVWFRNTWSWRHGAPKPEFALDGEPGSVRVEHPELGSFRFDVDAAREIYFCDNETNAARVFGRPSAPGYFKDAIHDRVIDGDADAVNPEQRGTKAAAHYRSRCPAGGSVTRAGAAAAARRTTRRSTTSTRSSTQPRARGRTSSTPCCRSGVRDADERLVQRQALAGMIWSKQFYYYDCRRWLAGDPAQPPPPASARTAATPTGAT